MRALIRGTLEHMVVGSGMVALASRSRKNRTLVLAYHKEQSAGIGRAGDGLGPYLSVPFAPQRPGIFVPEPAFAEGNRPFRGTRSDRPLRKDDPSCLWVQVVQKPRSRLRLGAVEAKRGSAAGGATRHETC